MSTPATAYEYKVVRLDADSLDVEIARNLTDVGREGWKLASTYHLHHLNAVFYVLFRETGAPTK
ncbi:MAG: hypothetical protein WDO13_21195 [Verrucomicrobiota bacterium]